MWVNVLFGTLWYDLVVARDKRVYRGEVEDAPRMVIYLIFPKSGLLDSHVRALTHFREHGYAPLVICNVVLGEDDRKRLLALANHLIERPNYGYDFGGYRDAILFLRDQLPELDRLVLMNDSVWFPLTGANDWLVTAEGQGCDVVGAVSNFFGDIETEGSREGQTVSWRYDVLHPRFHYCSFALSFGPAVLKDRRFLNFWERLKLSNNKIDTVHRGEVGLGQWVVHSGHSHGCTLDLSRFDVDLDQLEDARLREVAENLIIPESPTLRAEKALVLARAVDAPDARVRLKDFILRATVDTGPAYALLDFALREKRHGFVKKSPLWLDPEGASITMRLLSEQGEDALHKEALMLLEQRGLSGAATAS